MTLETADHPEIRTEPSMFSDGPRQKPDGQIDPAGEVGWFLQREREKRGVGLEQAGEDTGIHPYHIQAIEYGDMTHMPQRLEALEMIAGYAQYLGFDAEPLIEHMIAFLPPPPVARRAFHPASPPVLSSAKILAFGKLPKLPKLPPLNIRLSDYPGGTGGIVASAFAVFMVLAGGNWMLSSNAPTATPTEEVAQAAPAVDTMPTASTGPETAAVKVTESPIESAAPVVADDAGAAAVPPEPDIAATEDPDALGNFIQEQIPVQKSSGKKITTGDVQQTDDGRVYGAANEQARVVLKAKGPVWLRIEDAKGNVVMTQMLSKGDTYRVPNRDGLIALSRDGGRLAYIIDGKEKGVLGPAGQILVGEKLDVASLELKK
jgi:cytoskeleton protein RodZ